MSWYDKANLYYNILHSWDLNMVRTLVEKGKITKAEYKEITGEDY